MIVFFLIATLVASAASSPEIIYVTPENAQEIIGKLDFLEMRERRSKPFTFFVEGIVGTGKSTLLQFFQNYRYMDIIPEPVDKWTNLNGTDMLKLIYQDPARWGADQESLAQLTIVKEHMRRFGLVKGMERSLHSARLVFAEALKGKYTDMEYGLLDGWYRMLRDNFDTSADLIVYLQTDPHIALKRAESRGRPEEQGITLNFLNTIHRFHEDWLIYRNTTIEDAIIPAHRILVINTNHQFAEMKRIYHILAKKVWHSIPNKDKVWCSWTKK